MPKINFDLESFLPYRMHQASEFVSLAFRDSYREEFGITRNQWRVVAHVGRYGPLTATQIGASADLHKTKVSRAIFTLERRGWLTRQHIEKDRRTQLISLTDDGDAAYARLVELADAHNEKIKKQLGYAEFENLLKALTVLGANNPQSARTPQSKSVESNE